MGLITLTTDFGTRDWFVGTMKGVIARIAPEAAVVDLTHDLPPGDIRAGAFALAASCRYFPYDTIHVVVLDPGVGSQRRAIAVQTGKGIFVGPDNGVLSWALAREKVVAIHALENKAYVLQPVSRTFHGRDVFAPVGGHLSRGVPIRKFGPALEGFVRLEWPKPTRQKGRVEGEVVYIDRFGNAITNIDASSAEPNGRVTCEAHARRHWACPVKSCYQAVPPKKPVAVVGSSGFLEIAINGGSAAKALGVRIGTRVVLRAGV